MFSNGDKTMITKGDALLILAPGAEWNVLDGKIEWLDTEQTQPTDTEIRNEVVRLSYLEEVEEYKRVRELAYPSSGEQFDKIFHDGVDAWKADIQAIKDAHPKAVIDADELAARQATALADYQAEEYIKAKTRLEQYVLSVGVPESTEEVPTGAQVWDEDKEEWKDGTVTITTPEIPALEAQVEVLQDDENDGNEFNDKTVMVDNPLIVQDRNERVAAQAIVDATPQSVKDSVDGV